MSEPATVQRLEDSRRYLVAHRQTPEAYIIGLFTRYDVVLLAEDHAIKHNLLLVQNVIPLLYEAGVTNFGMEFGAEEDQAALDRLVTADAYDERLARRLMFNYNVGWAYQEYMDIYRAAWRLNRSLEPGRPPFRILNLSYRYDWSDFAGVTTPAAMARVFHRGGTEAFRANLVRREVLGRGEKILILTGAVHAWTRYAQPVFDYNSEEFYRLEDRHMGNLLHRSNPGRICSILLHQPFDSLHEGAARLVYPAGGAIDQLMEGFADKRVGFDLVDTPLGALPDNSFYATGRPDFRLQDLADGYIYERPFHEYEGCTVDRAFLAEDDWPEARAQFPDSNWHRRPENLQELWVKIESYADLRLRYGRLEARPYKERHM